jgi:hypothetical protein
VTQCLRDSANKFEGILNTLIAAFKDHSEQTLFIVDAYANSNSLNLKATAITALSFRGWYLNFSTSVITQNYNAIN